MIELVDETIAEQGDFTLAGNCNCSCGCLESLADDAVGPVGADKASESSATYTGNEYDING